MNKHTVSLKLAKQMKKLGWEKETLFWWHRIKLRDAKDALDAIKSEPVPGNPTKKTQWVIADKETEFLYGNDGYTRWKHDVFYPAPIASELLEELPVYIGVKKWSFPKANYKYIAWDITGDDKPKTPTFSGKTPAEALALMWIYLKENKLI